MVVVGSSCAGKSTFAAQLAAATNRPRIELDELFWSPNWTPKPQAEFLRLVQEAAAGDTWVAAGNYAPSRPVLWARATTVVWLNYGLPLLLWRGVKRTIARAVSGEVLYHGNRESFRRSFLSRESILWWIVSTYRRRRREFEALRDSGEFAHLRWIEVRNSAEATRVLYALTEAGIDGSRIESGMTAPPR